MRAFVTCAILATMTLAFGAASAQAHDWHYHHRRPVSVYVGPPVVVRSGPVFVAPGTVIVGQPAPYLLTQPTYVAPVYGPAPVVVAPAVRPALSIRLGFGR